ncbi:hypothetical protein [Streptomyces sp. NPDC048155]|uniref:hypothetical protein n=1 Tax=Streptomyces sp. NPDC048155 TaxID=3154818 RepID=UPI0034114392
MADEHYEWLDKDAAERMLRGEPVDPVGGHACTEAEMLAAALDAAARAARPATGELPGEAAALAAFRTAAHSARARTRAAHPQVKGHAEQTSGPARPDVLEPVHIRPASGGPAANTSAAGPRRTSPPRWSRPIRFGLVASFAGCALGGVAVAAGTGMLPGPFGGHDPVPATSVSAAATPEELGSGTITDETPLPRRSASPDTEPSAPPAAPSAPGGHRDSGKSQNRKGGDEGRKPGGAAGGSSKGTGNGKAPGGSGGLAAGDWYTRALKACRAYRGGDLDDSSRRRLEALAKGARNLDRFCDRVIARAGKGGQGNQGSGNGSGNGNGNDDEQGGDGDANGDGGGNSGTLPPIRFTTTPSPSTSNSAPAAPPAADRVAGAATGSSR